MCEVRSFTRTVCGCALRLRLRRLTHVSAGTTLAEISQRLGLQRFIYVDHKAERNGWAHNAKLGEDVFEALIGAIYLDLGLVHAKRFILGVFEHVDIDLECDTNAKVRNFVARRRKAFSLCENAGRLDAVDAKAEDGTSHVSRVESRGRCVHRRSLGQREDRWSRVREDQKVS